MFRRGYDSIYHRMKGKHLYQCLHDFTGRAETRTMDPMAQMEYMVGQMVGKALPYTRPNA